jgi:uncharacterized protein involved in exopolysaccharide biosynthesis
MNFMTAKVFIRNVLTAIVNDYNLYRSELKRLPMDDVVEIMRNDIKIIPMMAAGGNGRNVPAFTVQFSYQDRGLAAKVVQNVVGRFVSDSTSNRSAATTGATGFLKDERDQAKKDLDALEKRVSDFKIANNGRLPDQVDMNSRQLSNLENSYQNLTSSKTRAELEKLSLETSLRVENGRKTALTREVPSQTAAAAAAASKSDRVLDVERDIHMLEDTLNVLLQSKTEAHPDVQNVKGRLELAKTKKQDILKEEAEAKTANPPAAAATAAPVVVSRQLQSELLDLEGNIQRLESAGRSKDLEIEQLASQIQKTQAAITKLEGLIRQAPLEEQEYSNLLREKELARVKYVDLDERLNRAQLSQNLETAGQGEKLELLDPPSLPQIPTEPKRPMVIAVGAGLGLLLGVVMAAGRELKDTSLKNLKDVRAYTQMAILGSVPLLENDFVVRRRKRLAWLGWTTACLMAVLTMAGSVVYYYYRTAA